MPAQHPAARRVRMAPDARADPRHARAGCANAAPDQRTDTSAGFVMRPAVMRSIAGLVPYQGKGEQNGRAILDEEKVRRILRRNADGSWLEKTSALASEFSVCEKTIVLVRQRKRWGHVND